jgi:hypothetical protein
VVSGSVGAVILRISRRPAAGAKFRCGPLPCQFWPKLWSGTMDRGFLGVVVRVVGPGRGYVAVKVAVRQNAS